MAKLWQFSQGHPNPAFSKKVQRKDPEVVSRKSHYLLIKTHLTCDSGANNGTKSARMAKWWQVFARSPKTRIFSKSAKGGPREIFQKSPKRRPRLKDPKPLLRKWHYLSISMHLNCKDWRRFWGKQRLQKCPTGQDMAIFARSPECRIFWKSAKGRPRKIFQKLPKKKPWFQRANSTLVQVAFSSN